MAKTNGDMQMPEYDEQLSTEQLLDAQAHIWNHIFSFINSMSLKSAVQLGIPDIIHNHGRPMSLSELVDALPIHKEKSQCIRRLMRLLVYSKIFVIANISNDSKEEDQDEVFYWLTPTSRLLLKGAPLTVVPFAFFVLGPTFIRPWQYLSEWLMCGDNIVSAFEIAHGHVAWKYMEQNMRLGNLFNEAMSCDGRLVMPILLEECKEMFEGVELVVDVGGGVGTTAMAILDAFPGKKCIVLDLPHVVGGLEGSKDLTFVGGDMFQSVPHGDVVLLKWILHDWNDDDCVRILKKCKEAILDEHNNNVGKVIIIDMVLDENGQREGNEVIKKAQLLYDMAMMTYLNGKERNEKEWAKLFKDTGFSSYKISPVLGMRSVIEVYP